MKNININIEILIQEKKQIWDDFVDDSNNGTIFHKQKFLGYHKDKFKDNEHHLLFYEGGKLISVLPLAIFESEEKKVAKSPYGASFGGFVYKKATYYNVNRIIQTFKKYCIENDFDITIITLPPIIYNQQPDNYQDFCMLKENFKLINRDLTSIIPLQNLPVPKIFDSYRYSCKRKIRKALKSEFKTKKLNDLNDFYKVLMENHHKFKKIPTHSLDELKILKNTFPSLINIFGVYAGDELAAGILCISVNKRVVLSFYICHKEKYDDYGVTALALHSSITWAAENNFDYFDLGRTTSNMIINEGGLQFKDSFSSTAIFKDTFTLEL